jgi:pilus assembly protein Flp/PilA
MITLLSVGKMWFPTVSCDARSLLLDKEIRLMLKFYVKASDLLTRLREDKDGVVSFEYVIVAACIIGAVAAAFGTGATGGIGAALTTAIGAITAAVTAAT